MSSNTETDTVVIGGGLAGLTTAVGLLKHGIDTVVVEREETLGGRARAVTDPVTGDVVSYGPHILMSEYPNMLKLLGMFGSDRKIVWQTDKFIDLVKGERVTSVFMRPLPPPFHFVPCILRERSFFRPTETMSNARAFVCLQMDEDDLAVLDKFTALEVLRWLGVNEAFIDKFWAFACHAIMNVPIDRCSAASLFRFFRLMLSHKSYHMGFADGGLGDLFAPGAARWIEDHGGRILTQTSVRTMLAEDGRVTGVELEDGRRISARHIVAAMPAPQLARIVPQEWSRTTPFDRLQTFEPCPYICTYLWFDRKLTDRQFWAREYHPDDLNCDFYDYSNIYTERTDPRSLIGTNCIYSDRASSLSDEEIVAGTMRELAEFLPETDRAELLHSLVLRIPMAIHCSYPGVETARPPVATGIDNLFIAGDWINTQLPASMESACCSGWKAAEAVLTASGRPTTLAMKPRGAEGFVPLIEKMTKPLRRFPVLGKRFDPRAWSGIPMS